MWTFRTSAHVTFALASFASHHCYEVDGCFAVFCSIVCALLPELDLNWGSVPWHGLRIWEQEKWSHRGKKPKGFNLFFLLQKRYAQMEQIMLYAKIQLQPRAYTSILKAEAIYSVVKALLLWCQIVMKIYRDILLSGHRIQKKWQWLARSLIQIPL